MKLIISKNDQLWKSRSRPYIVLFDSRWSVYSAADSPKKLQYNSNGYDTIEVYKIESYRISDTYNYYILAHLLKWSDDCGAVGFNIIWDTQTAYKLQKGIVMIPTIDQAPRISNYYTMNYRRVIENCEDSRLGRSNRVVLSL